jgi:hypothetical protein
MEGQYSPNPEGFKMDRVKPDSDFIVHFDVFTPDPQVYGYRKRPGGPVVVGVTWPYCRILFAIAASLSAWGTWAEIGPMSTINGE